MSDMDDTKPQHNLIDARRKMRRLALPLVLGVVLLLVLPILTALMLPPYEVAFVANLTLLCTCLVPMLIVLALVYFGVMIGIFYMTRAKRATHQQLNRAYTATLNATERVQKVNETLNRRAAGFGVRAARLDVLWDIFHKSANQKESNRGQPDQYRENDR